MIIGKYKPNHDISLFKGEKMIVNTKKPRDVNVDGDIKTRTPIELSVVPEILAVYTPAPEPTTSQS